MDYKNLLLEEIDRKLKEIEDMIDRKIKKLENMMDNFGTKFEISLDQFHDDFKRQIMRLHEEYDLTKLECNPIDPCGGGNVTVECDPDVPYFMRF